MKTKSTMKKLVTLLTALAVLITSIVVYQPKTTEAASEKTTVNKNRIEFVTTETMKGKDYTEENMLLNRTTAITTYKGQKTTLVPVYIYQNGKLMGCGKNCVSYKTLKYKSSKSSVASVNKKGVITPKKNGTATITVSSVYNSKVKGTIEVTVTTKAKAVKAAKKESKKAKFVLEASHQKTCDTAWMYPGEYMTLSMKYSKNMKNKKLKWKSSDKSIATVNKNGVVTTKKKGSVTITATSTADKSVKATFEIEVKRLPTEEEYKKEHMSPVNSYCDAPGILFYPVENRRDDSTIIYRTQYLPYKEIHLYMNTYDHGHTVVSNGIPQGPIWDEKANFNVDYVYGASSQEVIYTNSNPEVGELDEDYVFVPKKPGKTVITVESAVNKKLKYVFTVTVEDSYWHIQYGGE